MRGARQAADLLRVRSSTFPSHPPIRPFPSHHSPTTTPLPPPRHWSLLGPELAQVLSGALTRAHAAASTGHPTLSLSMGLVAASVAGTLILAAVKPSVAQHVALGFGGVGHARAVEDGTPVAVLSHEVTLCASPDPPRTHAFATGR